MNEEDIFNLKMGPAGEITVMAVLQDDKCVSLNLYEGEQKVLPELSQPLAALRDSLQAYIDGKTKKPEYPYVLNVTDFEGQVLAATAAIPLGETATYREVAERIGRPGAYRAVGHALATNPLPLFIPCHRVVPSTGKLGNYSFGGTKVKAYLLATEKKNKSK